MNWWRMLWSRLVELVAYSNDLPAYKTYSDDLRLLYLEWRVLKDKTTDHFGTDQPTNRLSDQLADGQTDERTDRQTDRHIDSLINLPKYDYRQTDHPTFV